MQQVIIVGAGLVGLTLAAELARFGVQVRIIDRSPRPTATSQALVVWSRTIELMVPSPGDSNMRTDGHPSA